MHIPFVDLKAQYESLKDEVAEAIRGVLDKRNVHFSNLTRIRLCFLRTSSGTVPPQHRGKRQGNQLQVGP